VGGAREADRRDHDDARIAHHAELVVVSTWAIQEIASEGQMLVLMNQREIGARRGLIVSGTRPPARPPASSSSAACMSCVSGHASQPGHDRIPVVYVTCPPKGSPRKLAMEFARFLGLRTRANVTDTADAVCQVLIDARTDLVLVDEIHNLNHGIRAGEDLSDHLKYFTEHLPATVHLRRHRHRAVPRGTGRHSRRARRSSRHHRPGQPDHRRHCHPRRATCQHPTSPARPGPARTT
jgi:AAA domain